MSSLERFPLRSGVSTVVRREQLTPRMLRLTLTAPDFGPDWPIRQPGEIITLLFIPQGEPIVLPVVGWRFPGGAPTQEWRNYTVRAHRPVPAEIDVDVLLHEPRGPACTWAAAAQVGDEVGYAGPRIDFAPEPDAGWTVLCGDETALPAIAAILETTPDGQPVQALVEVDGPTDEVPLALRDGQRLDWVHRSGEPAGATDVLAAALRRIELPEGVGQAWGAAESKIARDLREVLRDELGMPKSHARARGYWLRSGEWDLSE
ncbi:MAG: siderophore-interacting protein [Solirubrobacteraceae bacterium]|nr:siderophore-interacting protein [Solirubrobacteraceae bacterium]